ncbi:MAG TPA: hypothetical protein VIR30_20855, partial [Nocardioides sp.]
MSLAKYVPDHHVVGCQNFTPRFGGAYKTRRTMSGSKPSDGAGVAQELTILAEKVRQQVPYL